MTKQSTTTAAFSLGFRYIPSHLLFYGDLGDMGGNGNRLRANIRLCIEWEIFFSKQTGSELSLF